MAIKTHKILFASIVLLASLILIPEATSSEIRIYNKSLRILTNGTLDDYKKYPIELVFTITWNSSWHNEKNHDAAWVFIKLHPDAEREYALESMDYLHAKIEQAEIVDNPLNGPRGEIQISSDSLGFFIYPSVESRGSVAWTVRILLNNDEFHRFGAPFGVDSEVHALEMVYIPKSSFYAGAVSEKMLGFGAFYQSKADSVFGGPYKIESEDPIEVGPDKGQLWYSNFDESSMGDYKGPIPNHFPKGYHSFYIMKYELTQGQYATFLNSLFHYATDIRSIIGGKRYYMYRGTIRVENDKYVARDPDRPANYLSWADALSYLDWAALRPMTELEMEKAMRGPKYPKPLAYAWGTDNIYELQRSYFGDGSYGMLNGMSEDQMTDDNRPIFGASYYWVMDLSAGVSEPVVAASSNLGRQYKGTHGDGIVFITYAEHGNADWPTLERIGPDDEADGGGFKGGGVISLNEVGNGSHPFDRVSSRYAVDRAGAMTYRFSIFGCRGVRTVEN